MTDLTAMPAVVDSQSRSLFKRGERTRRRHAAEKRFRMIGLAAVIFGILALFGLLGSILNNGASSFRQTYITLDIHLDPAKLDKTGDRDPEALRKLTTFSYQPLIKMALDALVEGKGVSVEGLTSKDLEGMISKEAPAELRRFVLAHPSRIGETVTFAFLADGRIDGYYKGRVTMATAELDRNVTPEQLRLADKLKDAGVLATRFNWSFLTAPDASDTRPEAAGLGVAILGSAYMMLIVLVLSLPIGVAASIYLEEFAPRNRLTDVIEVNIANLAAVPSIVFGILGLAVFINYAGLPQSAPIVGGLVLTLMTLPTIIIATRAALKAVPPSIREAALGVGASKMQAIFHHVLPLAAPGILTGTIIGLAQALGETAPLLLIGMVAFVREFPAAPPGGFFDPASALPVQVYNWTQRGDPAFIERASGAIIVLLVFLIIMNLGAIFLRRRFERRW
ncbi:phosphate ABC transporter permease [Nitratireductor indicus C115]|uniref:Phosphate transport system permease protein PstA n=2 Tax=Nitratireductor indicus TaxID=721133 RepID=K2P3J3_9HYPH|nr:phosphate ABC transporter permease PstA [Nitratireductor indicus]EKF41961.1 phosphate ABC transporter permease [Nitratireductor indicus C115]MDS1136630.1 phosphate ABC transporter permease PstA [Nitratireductor indicus]SFQ47727.1 phosphate transport system permease protein [Nitratireductor indicus]